VVLFCKDGFAEFLEFFTFGAESFPQVLRSWQLEPWPGNSVAAARE
jgi:hypothetical protein